LLISSEDTFSPLTAGPNINDESIEESTIDWKNDSIETVTCESNDERIQFLQAEDDINDIGDGGSSNGKGEGSDCVHSFQDGMKDVEREHLDHDTDEIENCVEADDDDAIICDDPNMVPSALPGAPNGWSPPSPPNNWNSTINSLKRESPFEEVDNPGRWSSFTYCPSFQSKGGYMCHTMPAGATTVPVDKVSGKRQAGGFEFFYNGWKQENPTRENCRFAASRDLLFPPDRQVQLDVNYLKKM
jgi:hypothetical protein